MQVESKEYLSKSTRNIFSSFVQQIVVVVIGLILPRQYIITYGSSVNGLVTSITQFISYFTIVEAGLSSAGINALYKPLSEKDLKKTGRVLSAIRKYYFQVGYIFSGLVAGLAFIYPFFVSVDGLSYADVFLLVLVLGMSGALDFFTIAKYRALLTADQRGYVIANASTLANIGNFLIVIVAMKVGCGITAVRILALAYFVIRSLIVNLYARREYPFVKYNAVPDTVALSKRWDAMILQLLGLAQSSLPIILLTFFSDDLAIVSVYSIYNLVASNISTIMLMISNGVSASFGDILAKDDYEQFRRMYVAYEVLFLFLTAVVYSCMLVLYVPFLRIYTRGIDDYQYILPVTAFLFTVNGLAYNLKTPAGTLIGATGLFKETKKGTLIQTCIAVVACILLTPLYGINGLLSGLIFSNVYRDFDLVRFMNKNIVRISVWKSVKNFLATVLTCLSVGAIFGFFTLPSSNYFEWMLCGIVVFGVSVVLGCLFFLLFNGRDIPYIVAHVFRRHKNRKIT